MSKLSLDTHVERRTIRPHDDVVIELPYPPSTNNLFANGQAGRYVTQAYRDWRTTAGWKIKIARTPRVPGAVKVCLEYEDKAGRRDLDNLIKACMDLLVEHHIIDGDHRTVVREINAKWSNTVQGVRVTISPAKPEARAA